MIPYRRPRHLRADRRGATAIEFAIAAPVLLLMIVGFCELTYEVYVASVLEGALQKAGRDITLETASSSTSAIDQSVESSVRALAANATFNVLRKNFHDFADVRPEPFTDANSNDVYDSNECFSDENGNGTWDKIGGRAGAGGANDVVLYTMTVNYPRPFPVASLFGGSPTQTAAASTLLRSQPYGDQAVSTTPPVVCPG
jgi:Flp pilus assembly protein TadG